MTESSNLTNNQTKPLKIGFAMLSHRPPGQVFIKLLQRLRQFPNAEIVLHHDYGQSQFPEEVINKYNIIVLENFRNTKWGHISKVPATLDVFKRLYELKPEVDWFITISPNCYLIKPVNEIINFLQNARADAFMELEEIRKDGDWVAGFHYPTLFARPLITIPFMSRKGKFYWRTIRRPIDQEKTPFNSQYRPYCGADWYMVNRKTMGKILAADLYNHPTVPFITEANKYPDKQASPIEIIIQSFVGNQKDLVVDRNYRRFIDWNNPINWHPHTLVMKYFDDIKKSDALFARKFLENESMELIERIDKELL